MEHSFLDAGNGDIFSQKKKQKQDAKAGFHFFCLSGHHSS